MAYAVDAAYPFAVVKTEKEEVDEVNLLDLFDDAAVPNNCDGDHNLYVFRSSMLLEMDALDASMSQVHPAVTSAAPAAAKVRISAEEKKRRNRECMRRLRHRRSDLVVAMREEIQALEGQLNRQLELSAVPVHENLSPTISTQSHQSKQLRVHHTRIKSALRRLREENYWLHKLIAQKHECFATVAQLAQVREAACPPIDMEALEEEEINAWIRNVSHFFTPLHVEQAFDIVMSSYRVIQEGIRAINKANMQVNTVMGWVDQRSVDGCWANFTMQKAFPHEPTHALAMKTWRLVTNIAEISVLQPRSHEMKLVQRLNDNTLVVARHTYYPSAKTSYCMLYLLFLLEVDDGFVIGMRALEPDLAKMQVFTTKNFIHAKPYHCFYFQQQPPPSRGCTMTFAGRVDCVGERIAHMVAMDMLLAMMRWESHCVAPLWCLGS